jgi:hypothetical protein
MPTFSTAALMAAWEDGMAEHPVDRGPSLLRSLRLGQAGCDPADMTVGTCDLLLCDLRCQLFGPDLELTASCPECGEPLELTIPAAELLPAHAVPAGGPLMIEVAGLRIRCRLPTNADLRALADLGSAARLSDLLDRCIEEIHGSRASYSAAALAPAVAQEVADALAATDAGAEITAEIQCPCGAQWTAVVDIRSILWSELTTWAQKRMAEVHQLASAYGWAERDILEMSPYRRRFYLESCAG